MPIRRLAETAWARGGLVDWKRGVGRLRGRSNARWPGEASRNQGPLRRSSLGNEAYENEGKDSWGSYL
jgi:hypothetical protein